MPKLKLLATCQPACLTMARDQMKKFMATILRFNNKLPPLECAISIYYMSAFYAFSFLLCSIK